MGKTALSTWVWNLYPSFKGNPLIQAATSADPTTSDSAMMMGSDSSAPAHLHCSFPAHYCNAGAICLKDKMLLL